MGGAFPLFQHVGDTLHADDVLAVHVEDRVIGIHAGRVVFEGTTAASPGFPRRLEIRHFTSALADLGELAVFVALGLTIDL